MSFSKLITFCLLSIGVNYTSALGISVAGLSFMIVKPLAGTPILPDKNPANLNHFDTDTIKIVAAKGEYEPASIVLVTNKTNSEYYDISVVGFSGGEHLVKNKDIDIRYVLPWYQASGAWESHRTTKNSEPVLVPELLTKDPYFIKNDLGVKKSFLKVYKNNLPEYIELSEADDKDVGLNWSNVTIKDAKELQPIKLVRDHNQQIWLTVHIPRHYLEGKYTGLLRIKSKSDLLEIPIEITILPFQLDKPNITYAMYYRGRLDVDNKEVFSEYKNTEQLISEISNMVEHGICCPTLYQRIVAKYARDKKHGAIEMIKRHMNIRKQNGVDNKNLYYLGVLTTASTDSKILDQVSEAIKSFKKSIGHYDVANTYIYGVEEVQGEKLSVQKKAWDSAKNAGVKIFTAGSKNHVETMMGQTDLLIYYGEPNRTLADKVHDYGNKIFSYANPQSGPENPELFRKNYGYRLISTSFDGAMIYAYQHAFGNIWNDFDHQTYRDHVLAYPTTDNVIDTVAWEGLREAVDDARYYSTAVNKLQEKKGSNGEVGLHDWLVSQCTTNSCDPKQIRRQLIRRIEKIE